MCKLPSPARSRLQSFLSHKYLVICATLILLFKSDCESCSHRLVSHFRHTEDFLHISFQSTYGLVEAVAEREHCDREFSKMSHTETLGTCSHLIDAGFIDVIFE